MMLKNPLDAIPHEPDAPSAAGGSRREIVAAARHLQSGTPAAHPAARVHDGARDHPREAVRGFGSEEHRSHF